MTPAPAPPSIPEYELLRPIGRGSYGEVWLARSVTGVFRVIKIVRRDRFDDERPYLRELEGITRFQIAASGRPRQLALLHVGRNDRAGYFYYVMEPADDAEAGSEIDPDRYIPLTLKELFSRRGRLPATECIHLSLELARGLAVLHASNLIHRDIKPSNIIFVQRVPKLADVGLVADSEATMTCAGTPGYAPREGAGTVAADIFSLGKVLYEITTGLDRMEFPRLPQELADATDIPLLRELNSIVLRACHPDPAQRHPSAEALARDLELVQAGRSVAFYEALRRRTRAIAMAAAAFTLVAGLGTALLYWRAGILQRANDRARHALYRSDLAVAQLARAGGDLGRARAALARQIPQRGETDLRGLEWSILSHSVRGEGTPLESATNGVAVTQIAVDPSGRWVAASFADQSAALWDLPSGRIVERFDPGFGYVRFTAGGELVTVHPTNTIRYYSPSTRESRSTHIQQPIVSFMDDMTLWTQDPSSEHILSFYDISKDAILRTYDFARFATNYSVLWNTPSKDGGYTILGLLREQGIRRERKILSVDLSTNQEVWEQVVSGRILWIYPSPDSKRAIANIGGLAPAILSYHSNTPQTRLVGHTARVQDASFSTDGTMIATAGADQTIRTWRASDGALLTTMRGLGRPATAVTWGYDGRIIIAGDESGSLRAFDYPPPQSDISVSGLFDDVHGDIVFSRNGESIAASMTSNSVAIISSKTLAITKVLTNLFQPIAHSADDSVLFGLSIDLALLSVDLSTGSVTNHGRPLPENVSITAWELSPNQRLLAVSGNQGELFLIDLDNKTSARLPDQSTNAVWAISFESSGVQMWTGNSDGTIWLWNTKAMTCLGEQHRLPGDIQCLTLSSDGRWMAVALFNDTTIRVLDRTKSTWLSPLGTHRRFASWMRFSGDNKRLLSAGADGKLVVWGVPEFNELSTFEVGTPAYPTGDEGIAVARISPAGDLIAALTEDGRLRAFRAEPITR